MLTHMTCEAVISPVARTGTWGSTAVARLLSGLLLVVSLVGCSRKPLATGTGNHDASPQEAADGRDDHTLEVVPSDVSNTDLLPLSADSGTADVVSSPSDTSKREVTSSPSDAEKTGALDAFAVDTPMDSTPVVDAFAANDVAICPYPLETFVDGNGTTQWWWFFDWQAPNLAEICASYGPWSTMVVEIDVPNYAFSSSDPVCSADDIVRGSGQACAVAGTLRVEISCTQGSFRFAVPSDRIGIAYYHIESQEVPGAPRHVLAQDDLCPRSLHTSEALALAPPPADGGTSPCPNYPSGYRVDSDGGLWWWRHFGWKQDDLASVCASYGPGAKMVLETSVGMPPPVTDLPVCSNAETMGGGSHACAMSGFWRFEADCTAGEMLFEVPWQTAVSGYYHIESAQIPDSARRVVTADTTCYREQRPGTGPILPAGAAPAAYTSGADPGAFDYSAANEPAGNGQPCRTNSDCPRPSSQRCFIDAPLSACPDSANGRCVPYRMGNCMLQPGCGCVSFYQGVCGSAGATCRYLGSSTSGCAACLVADSGL